MSRARIAFATCDAQPQLYAEERELLTRLIARGADAEAVSWTAPGVDWAAYALVVIRSTWDYFERTPEFVAWLDRLEAARAKVRNSVRVLRWNMDKRYLLELEGAGVPIVPTEWVPAGGRCDLAALLAKRGWSEAVVKPTISGGAYRTSRISAATAASAQQAFDALVAEVGVLVQPFVPEIVTDGEWSLFFFGGEFSHAVIKRPAQGDYRVQPTFGGIAERAQPAPELLERARRVIALAPEPLLYARVDGVRQNGELLLMELEAIEPYLFFSVVPEAMDRYLDAVLADAGL